MFDDSVRSTEYGEGGRTISIVRGTGKFSSRSRILAFCFFLLFAAASAIAYADDMPLRCNGGVVQVGDGEATVRQKCGPPYKSARANLMSQTIRGHEVQLAPIMKWYYNLGSADYIYVLTIQDGKVTDIVTEGRGFATPYQ